MTGTGTQADPLVPADWEEFKTAVNTNGAYVRLPANTVYDMNLYQPNGPSTTLFLQCTEIEGNGGKIINYYAPKNAWCIESYSDVKISNMSFLNCYIEENAYMFLSSSRNTIFEDCSFSGLLFKGYLLKYPDSWGSFKFKRCTLDFLLSNSWISNANYSLSFRDCLINLVGICNYNNIFTHMERCTFTTILETSPTTGAHTWGELILNTEYSLSAEGSYLSKIDGYFKGNDYVTIDYADSNTYNLYNITKSPFGRRDENKSGILSFNNCIPCTESQINDAAYLLSQGFPVGV